MLGLTDSGGANIAGFNRDHRLESWRSFTAVSIVAEHLRSMATTMKQITRLCDQVLSLSPPPATGTLNERVILTPVESPWTSSGANPFSASWPDVPLKHAIELIPTDDRDVFMIENRQQGAYTADHLGDTVDYSTDIPTEGVIMYQGRRNPSSGVARYLPVNLLTPYANPLNTVGETYNHFITSLNEIDDSGNPILNGDNICRRHPRPGFHSHARIKLDARQ